MKWHKSLISRARELAAKGCREQDIAREFGVVRQTVGIWKQEHPEFLEAIQEGIREANKAVESALFRRALGFKVTEEVQSFTGDEMTSVKRTIKDIPPDVTAINTWLNNKDPENWRKTRHVELSGSMESVVRRGPPVLNFKNTSPIEELTLDKFLEEKSNKDEVNEDEG